MSDYLKRFADALKKDRKQGSKSKSQSGAKVDTRTEKMCKAGDETACARLREAQTTDSNN